MNLNTNIKDKIEWDRNKEIIKLSPNSSNSHMNIKGLNNQNNLPFTEWE